MRDNCAMTIPSACGEFSLNMSVSAWAAAVAQAARFQAAVQRLTLRCFVTLSPLTNPSPLPFRFWWLTHVQTGQHGGSDDSRRATGLA